IAFIALYFAAPFIAEMQMVASGEGEHRWSTEDITGIIRVVAIAVIIVAVMATWRGIFEGVDAVGATSGAYVIDQIVRILFLLGGSFVVIYMLDGTVQTANEVAVFAAFIGGLSSLATLWYFWRKRKPHIQRMVDADTTDYDFSYREMYSEIVRYGIPFI